ncbi:FTR1 family protein [Dongia sp.]|uniref:FTR1 family iron permease n=1 Tax=Dongia sp. TaxID=1977262 RepID=UPI0035B28233
MIIRVLRSVIMALAMTAALAASPATADVPWQDAEALRTEAADILRRLYRTPDPDLRRDVAERLVRVHSLWRPRLEAAYGKISIEQAQKVSEAIAALDRAVLAWNPAGAAAAGAAIWTGLLDGAFHNVVMHLDNGTLSEAADWLNIREFARTSRTTAAGIAMRETLAGRMSAGQARKTIELELLGIYAGEMRMAVSEARTYLSKGYKAQLSGALARARGLHHLLADSIAARLDDGSSRTIAAAFMQLGGAGRLPDNKLETLLADLETRLATYAPASLPAEELDRRVRLLSRFLKLVYLEYEKGVRDGEVTIPIEYLEAGLFRDRAEMLFGDLGYDLAARAPESLDRLASILSQTRRLIEAKGDETLVKALTEEAQSLIASAYGTDLAQGGYKTALSLLPDILDEVLLVAQAGDWPEADLKRLEAYALFDPDIEQRLMPRSPALALKMEAGFWEGSATETGLGRLIADKGPEDALKAAVVRMKMDTAEAAAILNARLSATNAFLQSMAIMLREGLEALLVLACMIGALKATGIPTGGLRGWRWPVVSGVAAALAGSFALWLAVGQLFAMSTLQRELLEGLTALTAAAVLFYVTHWIFQKAYVSGWVAEIRRKAALAGSRPRVKGMYLGWFTLFALAFLVVFREGFETVLFYEALLIDAPDLPVLAGLGTGAAISALAAYAVLGLEARLPVAAFFRVTGAMLGVLCLVLTGSGIRGLQTAALVPATPVTWFPDMPWLQLYLGLYPVAETLSVQGILAILLLSTVGLTLRRASSTTGTN